MELTELKDLMKTMEPQGVWKNFYAITQVPRSSHQEEEITAFMADFGKRLGLETIVSDVGNVLIRKPATPGMENCKGVVLQAHMDMVAQKSPDKVHDFKTDPITPYVENGWVRADGTTLGADDGIGVAIIMMLLEATDIPHGNIEAFFTVDEEDGFIGVNALQPNVLQGEIYMNIDWETEGSFAISSAGGVYVDVVADYEEEVVPAGLVGCEIKVTGLKGGHSGMDINQGRGNASRLLARLLWTGQKKFGIRLASFQGGDRYNAIPSDAVAVIAIPQEDVVEFNNYVASYQNILYGELGAQEPNLKVAIENVIAPMKIMPVMAQRNLLNAIYGSMNGVMAMSTAIPGLVETSASMGIVTIANGKFMVGYLVRSAVDSARDDQAQKLQSVYELAGAKVSFRGVYSGWKPNPKSPILALMQDVYKKLFDKDVQIEAVHAGLETSVVGLSYPHMDMISFGPTLVDVHSVDERMEIASVKKVVDLLVATLQEIPRK